MHEKMATVKPARSSCSETVINCTGCVKNITYNSGDRRSLNTTASKHVADLLREFLSTSLIVGDSESEYGVNQIVHPQSKMCRKCYTAYERFISIRNTIERKS